MYVLKFKTVKTSNLDNLQVVIYNKIMSKNNFCTTSQ